MMLQFCRDGLRDISEGMPGMSAAPECQAMLCFATDTRTAPDCTVQGIPQDADVPSSCAALAQATGRSSLC